MKTKKKKQKVLIDGAAGYLGQHLVEDFIAAGYQVRATDIPGNDLTGARDLGAEVMFSNLTDIGSLRRACKGMDWVVHAAAAFDLGLPYSVLRQINVNGTRNLCRAIVEAKVKKLLHVSTGGVYGKSRTTVVSEDHPFKPVDNYSKSKYEAEQVVNEFVRDKGLNAVIFRPTALYGPGGKYIAGAFMTVPIIAREKGKHTLPVLSASQMLNQVHVKDVSLAAVFVLEKENIPSGRAFNLADSDIITAEDFFTFYYKAFGIRCGRRIHVPKGLFGRSMELVNYLSNDFTLAPANWWLERTWNNIVRQYDLKPMLMPRLSKDQLLFLAGDHAYDNSRLIRAGYDFKYPKFAQGFNETLKWYQDNQWIPRVV